MTEFARIYLALDGLGIIFYSPWAVQHIPPGTDYLGASFLQPEDIARHVNASSLTGFGTGGSGNYDLIVSFDAPDAEELQRAQFKVELGLEVRDETVCFRDLYELICWQPECPPGQSLRFPDGFYRVLAYTTFTPVGTTQPIYLSFLRVPERLELHFTGAPELC